jgi:hypothetical protein
MENLERLVLDVLEPARVGLGVPIIVTSGYRPPAKNAAVGGVAQSDHQTGKAADLQARTGAGMTWEQNTIRLAAWIRDHRAGHYGQLILEDHREHYRLSGGQNWRGKLWLHVSLPTVKHPGDKHDLNRMLVSFAPRSYGRLDDTHLA